MINFDHFKDTQQTAAVTHKSSFTGIVLVCLTRYNWCLIRKKMIWDCKWLCYAIFAGSCEGVVVLGVSKFLFL